MGALSFQELEQLLQQAGLDSASAAVGAAVALAESGGRPDAIGDAGSSFGLWQIHLPAHPEVSQACALDPSCAAAAAVWISNGGVDWTPWTTFTSGAYQSFLGAAQALVHWVVTLQFGQPGPSGATELGTDVAVAQGTQVLTPFSGTVTLVEDKLKLDWGKRVLVKIESGPLAGQTYGVGHLTDFAVSLGQHVGVGDTVGHSGGDPADPSSGESTGQHVEFQILDAAGRFIDPQQALGALGIGFGQLFGKGGPGAFNPLQGAEQAIASSIGDAAQKVAYFMLGIALIWLGVVLLVVGSIPWDRVARAVGGATPAGRAAGAARGAAA